MTAYFEKILTSIRNSWRSFLSATSIAVAVTFLVIYFGGLFEQIFSYSDENQILTKAALFIMVFVVGLFIFDLNALGLSLKRNLWRNSYLGLIPLAAIFVANPIGLPELINWSQVKITENLLTSLWEELFFRGFLVALWIRFCGLDTQFKRLCFILLSSSLFGVMHFGQPLEHFMIRTGIGIMFAMVVLQTQTLLLAIILHSLNNSASNIIQGTIDPNTQFICIVLLAVFSVVIACKGDNTDSRLNVLDSEVQEITSHP